MSWPSHQAPWHRPGTLPGRKVLVHMEGGSTHKFLDWFTSQRLSCSVGFALPEHALDLLTLTGSATGTRVSAFATNTATGAPGTGLADLKRRRRRRPDHFPSGRRSRPEP